jgi:hypothetical protein
MLQTALEPGSAPRFGDASMAAPSHIPDALVKVHFGGQCHNRKSATKLRYCQLANTKPRWLF